MDWTEKYEEMIATDASNVGGSSGVEEIALEKLLNAMENLSNRIAAMEKIHSTSSSDPGNNGDPGNNDDPDSNDDPGSNSDSGE